MREYSVLSPMIWIGKTGRALRKNPNAQRVAIYLMTAPSSEMTGVFYCPLSSILNDVGVFEASYKPLRSQEQDHINTNKQQTEVSEAIDPSADESVCCVSSHEDCFDDGEDFDAPLKVQAEQK